MVRNRQLEEEKERQANHQSRQASHPPFQPTMSPIFDCPIHANDLIAAKIVQAVRNTK